MTYRAGFLQALYDKILPNISIFTRDRRNSGVKADKIGFGWRRSTVYSYQRDLFTERARPPQYRKV